MKVCIIGEKQKSESILKAIVDDENLERYAEISGEINKSNEVMGYLPQIFETEILYFSTKNILKMN